MEWYIQFLRHNVGRSGYTVGTVMVWLATLAATGIVLILMSAVGFASSWSARSEPATKNDWYFIATAFVLGTTFLLLGWYLIEEQ